MKGGRVRIGCITHVPASALASGHGMTWCGKSFLINKRSQYGHLYAHRVSDHEEVDCMACITVNIVKGF